MLQGLSNFFQDWQNLRGNLQPYLQGQMMSGMANNKPLILNVADAMKTMFRRQMPAPVSPKYQRGVTPSYTGAGAPVDYNNLDSAMAIPYSTRQTSQPGMSGGYGAINFYGLNGY